MRPLQRGDAAGTGSISFASRCTKGVVRDMVAEKDGAITDFALVLWNQNLSNGGGRSVEEK